MIDPVLLDRIDHSREVVDETLRIANLFIDEARLNGNKFTKAADE